MLHCTWYVSIGHFLWQAAGGLAEVVAQGTDNVDASCKDKRQGCQRQKISCAQRALRRQCRKTCGFCKGSTAAITSGPVDTITMTNCSITSEVGLLSFNKLAQKSNKCTRCCLCVHLQASAVYVSDFKSGLQFTDCRFASTIGVMQSSYGHTIDFTRCAIIMPQA